MQHTNVEVPDTERGEKRSLCKNDYGMELVLDLHDCNPDTFTREAIELYFLDLCKLIDMEPCELHFWDDTDVPEAECQANPKTKDTSVMSHIKSRV